MYLVKSLLILNNSVLKLLNRNVYNAFSLLSGSTKRSSLSHHLYQLQINVTEHKICVLNRSVKLSTNVLTSGLNRSILTVITVIFVRT
jgi:hypothetical protein